MAKPSALSLLAFRPQPRWLVTFKLLSDPHFVAKMSDVCVLPPEHAVVRCVGETPHQGAGSQSARRCQCVQIRRASNSADGLSPPMTCALRSNLLAVQCPSKHDVILELLVKNTRVRRARAAHESAPQHPCQLRGLFRSP